jgi:predicted amidohydrolase YtcJ
LPETPARLTILAQTKLRSNHHFRYLLSITMKTIAFIAASSLLIRAVYSASLPADLVIVNAAVHTMDSNQPLAEAVAIYGNRIAAVGSSKEIRALAGDKTRVIDAGGKLVLPGFNDSHVHFLQGAFQLSNVDLRDAKTQQEFARRIGEFAKKNPRGRWITGGRWDHESWPGTPLPTKELIDPVTPDTPVFVDRLDGHMAVANSLALKLAGVTRDTKDPPGGLIVRDPKTGEPTGVLKDTAMSLVERVIPPEGFEDKLAAARAASDYAAKLGVTSVQDMSAGTDAGVYQELLRRGELKTRIYAVTPTPGWERIESTGVHAPFGGDSLRIGGLKAYADGSLGSTTAWLFAPYNDAPDTSGLPRAEMNPTDAMLKRVLAADTAGLQVMVHAIGDRANAEMLGIYEQVMKTNGERDRRYRIEHAQHLRPQDIARFARAHVIASMQPIHLADDGRWAEKRLGKERCQTAYAFRSLLDSGAALAFGTDWPVAPLDPIQGIAAAVTRRTTDGRNPDGWIPEQKISVEEAARAYTVGSAYAEFQENVKGTLTPGKLADLVMLDRDIFKIAPTEIEKARVLLTVMDRRVMYETKSIRRSIFCSGIKSDGQK